MNLFSYLIPLERVKVNSPLNGEIKVVENFGRRILLVNDAEQSGGTITGMWNKSLKNIKHLTFNMKNCLVLGLGGGTIIKLLEKQYPALNITAIEFDPVIIEVYKKYFKHNSPNSPSYLKRGLGGVKIIQADAFSWVKQSKEKYDLIVFDLFLGKFNPDKSRERAFLKKLKTALEPKGFILYNAHYQNDEEHYQKFLDDCRHVYPEVKLLLRYPYSRVLYLGN